MDNDKQKEAVRALKFTLFSASAGIIEAGSIFLLENLTSLPSWACYLIGLVLSVLWNFTLNRKFTFQSAANVPIAMLSMSAVLSMIYVKVFGFADVIRMIVLSCLHVFHFCGLNMLCNLVTEFLYQRFFVFGKSIDTAVEK